MRALAIVAALVVGFGAGLLVAALVGATTGWYAGAPVFALAGAVGGAVLVGRLLPVSRRG
jgi:hypothetical protein